MSRPAWVNPNVTFANVNGKAQSTNSYYNGGSWRAVYDSNTKLSDGSIKDRAANGLGSFTSYFDSYQNRYNQQANDYNAAVGREAGELQSFGNQYGGYDLSGLNISNLSGGRSGAAYQNLRNQLQGVDFNIAGPSLDPTQNTSFYARYIGEDWMGNDKDKAYSTTKYSDNTALSDTGDYLQDWNRASTALDRLLAERTNFENRFANYKQGVQGQLNPYLGQADYANVASSNLADLIGSLERTNFGYDSFASNYGYAGDPYRIVFNELGGVSDLQSQRQAALNNLNTLLAQQQAFTGNYNNYDASLRNRSNALSSQLGGLTIASAPGAVSTAINSGNAIQNAAGYTPFMSAYGYNAGDYNYRTLFNNLGGLGGISVSNQINTLNDIVARRNSERQAATAADTNPYGFGSRSDDLLADIQTDDLRYNLFELQDAERRRQQLRSDLDAYRVTDRFGNDVTGAVVGDILDPRRAALDTAYNGQSAQERIAGLQSQRDAELAAILATGQDLAGRIDAADITDETLLQSLDNELAGIRAQLDPYSGGQVTLSGGGKDLLTGEGASQGFLLSPVAQRLSSLLRTRGASEDEIAALMAQFESRLSNLQSQTPGTQVYSDAILSGLESQASRLGYDLSDPGLQEALSSDAYSLIGTAGYEDPTQQYRLGLTPTAETISGYRDTRNAVMDQAQALIDSYGGRLDAMTIADKQQLDALMAEIEAQQAAVQPYTGGRAGDILGSQDAGLYGAQGDVRDVLSRRTNEIALANAERERLQYNAGALNTRLQQDGLIYDLGMLDELEARRQELRSDADSYSILDRFGNQIDALTDDQGNLVSDFSAIGDTLSNAYALGDGTYQSAEQRLNALRQQRTDNMAALAASGGSAATGLEDVPLHDETELQRRAALASGASTGLSRYTGGQAVQDYLQGNDAAFNDASATIQNAAASVEQQFAALRAKRADIAAQVAELEQQLQRQRFYTLNDVAGREPSAEQMRAEVDLYNAQSALADMVAAEQRLANERARIEADMQAMAARQRATAEAHQSAQVTPITDVRAQQYSLVDPLTQDVTAYLAAVSGSRDDRRRGGVSSRTFRRSLGR